MIVAGKPECRTIPCAEQGGRSVVLAVAFFVGELVVGLGLNGSPRVAGNSVLDGYGQYVILFDPRPAALLRLHEEGTKPVENETLTTVVFELNLE